MFYIVNMTDTTQQLRPVEAVGRNSDVFLWHGTPTEPNSTFKYGTCHLSGLLSLWSTSLLLVD